MKKIMNNSEIEILEFDTFKDTIIKTNFPIDTKYICGACSICKTITKVHQGLCDSCRKQLLQYEEYLYIKTYCNWLENIAYEVHTEFNNILMHIEGKYPELKNKEIEEIKEIISKYRFLLENSTSYYIFKEEEIDRIKTKYNIKNTINLINIKEL